MASAVRLRCDATTPPSTHTDTLDPIFTPLRYATQAARRCDEGTTRATLTLALRLLAPHTTHTPPPTTHTHTTRYQEHTMGFQSRRPYRGEGLAGPMFQTGARFTCRGYRDATVIHGHALSHCRHTSSTHTHACAAVLFVSLSLRASLLPRKACFPPLSGSANDIPHPYYA